MRRKANPTLIGAFLIGGIALAVTAIFIFGSGKYFKETQKFILYFDESVNGLEVGADVKFKGVAIGRVDSILIHFNQYTGSAFVPVIIELDKSKMDDDKSHTYLNLDDKEVLERQIQFGLRGKLVYHSYVTGMLFVELNYFPTDSPPYFVQIDSPYAQIPTVGTDLQEVWGAATKLFDKITDINFDKIIDSFSSFGSKLDDGLEEIDFKAINDDILSAFHTMEDTFKDIKKEVDPITGKFKGALEKVDDALTKLQTAFHDDAPLGYELNEALEEIAGAARAIRILAEFLERNPKALLAGKRQPNSRR